MADLTGSPAQIKWAKDLRSRIMGAVNARADLVASVASANGHNGESAVKHFRDLLASLERIPSAEWWIEWGKSLDTTDADALDRWVYEVNCAVTYNQWQKVIA